jgi:hypothetical protein
MWVQAVAPGVICGGILLWRSRPQLRLRHAAAAT